ncbi:hypothetical protein BKN38_07290 [Helicobacter sp. CLO-3]|uniref:hypothetical protein n=1 Tax=unclassified Helicobacter TaxID=2593540 RepID=UPI000804AEFF|nr:MULTISPECIES: hypothetical protein [unclassified Helicobacter]OBV29407.1 hypothetical protein BA723_05605 [Helicobacter sp. CLO-3]OHU82358.1 hypothetical protein BKN38_07290 [Helicobacter sp. CLO-3]
MRIEMRKIHATPRDFRLEKDGVVFHGSISVKSQNLYLLQARLEGQISLVCDRSGEEFSKALNDDLVLYIADGFCDTQSQSFDTFDVIEFFDGFIDLDYILESEIASIQSDYHTKD